MQRPIQYIVPTALAVFLSLLCKVKDQILSSVRAARRPLVGIAATDFIQGQTVRQMLQHNKQGLWRLRKAGNSVLRVLIGSNVLRVAGTCDAVVGPNSAMAVDSSIRSVKACVSDSRLDTGWEEGSKERLTGVCGS